MLIPQIEGEWWPIAGRAELGRYNTDKQETIDFGLWQAADGTWQLAACVRRCDCGGRGRLLYRWQTDVLTNRDWTPMGIVLEGDPSFGEYPGGLQAPSVLPYKGEYYMFYGDWVNICMAWSSDGKSFARLLNADLLSGLFTEGHRSSARDPMVMAFRDTFYCYYTGVPGEEFGAIYCRTSDDLRHWSDSKIVSIGGSGGKGPQDAEAPFVMYLPEEYNFYLFRAHPKKEGGGEYETSVYCSPDPLDFGIDDDKYKVCALPYEVVRIVKNEGKNYMTSMIPGIKGIQMVRMSWVEK